MNQKFPYTLASNKIPKLDCPACGAKKHWQRYFYPNTKVPLPSKYGKCDNENKCGYILDPYKDGYVNQTSNQGSYNNTRWPTIKPSVLTEPKVAHFDFAIFEKTLESNRYIKNTFIQNLLCNVPYPFPLEDVTETIELYTLGTIVSGYRAGAITFPFINMNQNVRAIQVKQFNQNNKTIGTDFLHSIIEKDFKQKNRALPKWLIKYSDQDKKVTCLFGEHLLNNNPSAAIALVEAPKTAIYGHLYLKEYYLTKDWIWVAVYNKSSFTLDKVKALQGRTVYVFPDLSTDGKTYNE